MLIPLMNVTSWCLTQEIFDTDLSSEAQRVSIDRIPYCMIKQWVLDMEIPCQCLGMKGCGEYTFQ